MGFAGEVGLKADRVKIRKRFLGWANFIFDPQSPFFGKSASEVVGLFVSGARARARNLQPVAGLREFLEQCRVAAWRHAGSSCCRPSSWPSLGTLLGAVVAFPLAFLAARNITAKPARSIRRSSASSTFLRSVDMLIWALFFTRAFGPGPLAGSAAIFFTETGTLGKTLFRRPGKHR